MSTDGRGRQARRTPQPGMRQYHTQNEQNTVALTSGTVAAGQERRGGAALQAIVCKLLPLDSPLNKSPSTEKASSWQSWKSSAV